MLSSSKMLLIYQPGTFHEPKRFLLDCYTDYVHGILCYRCYANSIVHCLDGWVYWTPLWPLCQYIYDTMPVWSRTFVILTYSYLHAHHYGMLICIRIYVQLYTLEFVFCMWVQVWQTAVKNVLARHFWVAFPLYLRVPQQPSTCQRCWDPCCRSVCLQTSAWLHVERPGSLIGWHDCKVILDLVLWTGDCNRQTRRHIHRCRDVEWKLIVADCDFFIAFNWDTLGNIWRSSSISATSTIATHSQETSRRQAKQLKASSDVQGIMTVTNTQTLALKRPLRHWHATLWVLCIGSM